MATKRYLCPKCGENFMTKGSRTAGGKQRWQCARGDVRTGNRSVCYQTTDPTKPYRDQGGNAREPDKRPVFRRKLGGARRLLITWAQNATPAHAGFLGALKGYCEREGAELVVIPGR